MHTKALLVALFAAATASAAAIDSRGHQLPRHLGLRQANDTAAGADFGKCKPTMDFTLGREGRKPDQGTFLPSDPLVAAGQQDALNPNIITNRICDQLTNVCAANAAAKDQCLAAKAQISALGTKDASTATAWNAALGF